MICLLQVARDTYRTIKEGTMSDLASTAREIAQEWKVVSQSHNMLLSKRSEHIEILDFDQFR